MNKKLKFSFVIGIVVGTLAWLAVGGVEEAKAYYKTIPEVQAMGNDAFNKRLRVAGDVAPGSIHRNGKEVRFTIQQDDQKLNVIYSGNDPLPDTFRDNSQALADGRLQADGTFHANRIQAKCASKYEAKPGGQPAANPAYEAKPKTVS